MVLLEDVNLTVNPLAVRGLACNKSPLDNL